jgi:very-short-patch-repair endonuclease
MHRPSLDRDLAALAATQWGLITVAQAKAAGADRSLVARRVAAGRWSRAGRHVLRIDGAPPCWEQALLAAVLDVGPEAVATLDSAAALWELPGYRRSHAEVLVPLGGPHRPARGRVRETRTLPRHHVTTRSGIPTVTPARLVVELAGREHPGRVERAAENAIAASILDPVELASVISELACRGRRGSTSLRSLALDIAPGYVPPASELEARFRDLLRSAGLPEPARQLDAGGDAWVGRVDVTFPEVRLLIELDSRRWHASRSAMESDRLRDNALVLAGWRVIRITWRQIADDPAGVVALVRRLLNSAAAA